MCVGQRAPSRSLQDCGSSSMELSSCHASGPWNLEVTHKFWENLWSPALGHPELSSFKCGSTLVTLPRIVTPYRDSVDGTRDSVTYQKLVTR